MKAFLHKNTVKPPSQPLPTLPANSQTTFSTKNTATRKNLKKAPANSDKPKPPTASSMTDSTPYKRKRKASKRHSETKSPCTKKSSKKNKKKTKKESNTSKKDLMLKLAGSSLKNKKKPNTPKPKRSSSKTELQSSSNKSLIFNINCQMWEVTTKTWSTRMKS